MQISDIKHNQKLKYDRCYHEKHGTREFLTLSEFNALLKAAKDDRERCILLLLAGAGLRVGEMTQIRADDVITRVTSRLAKSRISSVALLQSWLARDQSYG